MRIFGLEIRRAEKALNPVNDWQWDYWPEIKSILLHPLSYVLFLGSVGAGMIVAGVALHLGTASALVATGVFMILGARYVSKGMTNG